MKALAIQFYQKSVKWIILYLDVCIIMFLFYKEVKRQMFFLRIKSPEPKAHRRAYMTAVHPLLLLSCPHCSKFEPLHGKTNNVVSEQVGHKPTCTSTEKS